jgi:predicted transcriptional regulator
MERVGCKNGTGAYKEWARFSKPSVIQSHRCMTMLSFRVGDEQAKEAQRWADRLGVDRSELLRQALHRHIVRLRAEADVEAWTAEPLSADGRSSP